MVGSIFKAIKAKDLLLVAAQRVSSFLVDSYLDTILEKIGE
jgi:hypothetical protein